MEPQKQTKYIIVTGGVLSSLGKGITSASLAFLLQQRGYKVTIIKLDPYLNVDPGTMSPLQHGEVYVTDDGAETDLDLGHYERFLNKSLSKKNNTTTGQVYFDVIQKERKGQFLGKTVQVIPHITNEIKKRMTAYDGEVDITLLEIGGTVGDIESLPFLEAARQLILERHRKNVISLHLTYVPYIKAAGEQKTKPTQHSVKMLMEYGIHPDILICRTEHKLPKDLRVKIGLFCNVDEESVIEALDLDTIYEVPLSYARRQLDEIVLKKFDLPLNDYDLETWKKFTDKIKNPKYDITIGFVGKYIKLPDAYKSITEAFIHAGSINNTKVRIKWINSEDLTDDNLELYLSEVDGVLVGPGFGDRGIEGKISAIKYVRENKIPFFGICLGMQCAVIEFARHVCGIAEANTGEITKNSQFNVIDLMKEQRNVTDKGGTMRLGAYPCVIKEGTLAHKAYGATEISERHRHRYELNNDFREVLSSKGLLFSGLSPDGNLVEISELPGHPWFLGVQFHPELKSRAVIGHPLFTSFIKAALTNAKSKKTVDVI